MAHKLLPYMRRLAYLRTERSTWRDHWRDIAEHVQPRRQRFDPTDRWRAGSRRNTKIVNNVGTRALRILASGMMASITSPARPWFRLLTPFPDLNRKPHIRLWLDEVQRRMLEVYAKSNIYNMLPLIYLDLGAFGTSAAFLERHPRDVVRGHVMPIGSYFLAQDQHYQVNTIYRETTLTVEQMVRKFGLENCSGGVQSMYKSGHYDYWMEVVQVIEPNDMQQPGMLDASGMPFQSVWFEYGGHTGARGAQGAEYGGSAEDKLLTPSPEGFHEFPGVAPRWMVTGEDVYGNAPAMEALGDIRGLQHLERKRALALNKIVDPVMNAPTAMRAQRTTLLSGGVNYVDGTGKNNTFTPAHTVDPRVLALDAELHRYEQRISSTFYADLFLMLANTSIPNMTAREVEERHEEKMLQLGPVLERIHDELLTPLIHRTFGIMSREGMIPDVPEEIIERGGDYSVEFVSIMAQAQKWVSTVGIEKVGSLAMQIAEKVPEALDMVDWDETIMDYAELVGVQPDMIRDKSAVAQMRQQRIDQQKAQEQAEVAKTAAQAGQAAANTPMGGGSALDALMAAAQPGGVGAPQ